METSCDKSVKRWLHIYRNYMICLRPSVDGCREAIYKFIKLLEYSFLISAGGLIFRGVAK